MCLCRTLTNCMYWFPLPFQLPVVIWPVKPQINKWKKRHSFLGCTLRNDLSYISITAPLGPQWCSGNTIASHLCGQWFKPWTPWGKVGSCLLMVSSLQYRTFTNCMYWCKLWEYTPFILYLGIDSGGPPESTPGSFSWPTRIYPTLPDYPRGRFWEASQNLPPPPPTST